MQTRKNTFMIALIAAVVLAFIAWTMVKRSGTPAASLDNADHVADASASVQGEPGMPPSASSQMRTVSPDDPGSLLAKPQDPAEEQKKNDATLAGFERQYRAEPVDAAWAGTAEPALDRIITNDGIVVSNIDPLAYRADCRSETCRISARFKTYADAQDWGTMYTTMTGETFGETKSMVLPQSDGSAELRIYGYRRR